MDASMSTQEKQLCQLLADLPRRHNWRYGEEAATELLNSLFWTLAGGNDDYMRLLFPDGKIAKSLKLSDAQGAEEGAEYTEIARGKRCGHIFKPGEASYMCRTCGTDETCCLCSRCFDSTDHTGHMVRIQISIGNSGCCDCGDDEAWKTPLFCTIHSDKKEGSHKGKGKETTLLPQDLVSNLQMTIGRVFDYICDVISCSPEQLRSSKTEESIIEDERKSRLSTSYCGSGDEACPDYALVLWNDEKHTVQEVQDQVARAVGKTRGEAAKDAWQTDSVGRSILTYHSKLDEILKMAKRMENIRVTVTVRSARDTFREQMCGTLVEWLSDISGCRVGPDNHILRRLICEELMRPWRQGSSANHISGLIDDEEQGEQELDSRARWHGVNARFILALQAAAAGGPPIAVEAIEDELLDPGFDNADEDDDYDEDDAAMDGQSSVDSGSGSDNDEDVMMVDAQEDVTEAGLNWSQSDQALEEDEATMAGYPSPPPPPPAVAATATVETISEPSRQERDGTPSDSDTAEPLIIPVIQATANTTIPKTPGKTKKLKPKPGRYWIETPAVYLQRNDDGPPAEDVFQRVRLDWLLLFDLRMWKKVRNDLRSLYISTVVQVPEFKRVLALRFASLYTVLAQLYLVGDREPDHSIINLSLQMLTTPSITAEVVERGNFMSSLLATLYTFLTTRQVGHPWHVSPDAVLAFESGSVTNRRMYHFYQDLKYLFGAPHVQERVRYESRYLMQFLDLVKLHQCIGPNVRAVVEHVEYEADSWITASLVTRQINLQARNVAESFRDCSLEDLQYLQQAIRLTTKTVIINSIGAERGRFKQAEIKEEVKFKTLDDFEFDAEPRSYEVVRFVIEKGAISFHHALHYTLSWLLECGKALSADDVRTLMSFTPQELKAQPRLMGKLQMPRRDCSAEDFLMAAFDYPLRVCAWLAQIKANMWVRNGMSLRHQATTYRGVGQRDVSHHRDIFLLQTAMVLCDPSRVLVTMIDRFGMDGWVKGLFELKSEAQDDAQHLDIIEDMLHLLIVILSDRTSLFGRDAESNPQLLAMRRDITHVLCFKPLSFNDICNKLPEKYQEQEDFHQVLDDMAIFKPPEGVSDVGTFELRQEFIEDIDPYIAHYNKNQREESEMAYRKKMAKKTGKTVDEIVYEPKPRPIPSGLFQGLSDFTSTGVFAQLIYYSLLYPLVAHKFTPSIPVTRLETFLQVVLHLVLIAITEDRTGEEAALQTSVPSFVQAALTRHGRSNFMPEATTSRTIVSLLTIMSTKEEFKAIDPKIDLVLRRLKQKRGGAFDSAFLHLGISVDRINTASPANSSTEEERVRKKKAAMGRQAKVMAQFHQQQKSFLEKHGELDLDSDLEDGKEDMATPEEDRQHTWHYPTGTCLVCAGPANNGRLYGTFALINESHIFRQTDFQDPDFVREAYQTPCNLDRSADDIRPFGIAHENRKMVEKLNSKGESFLAERQTIGKGIAPTSLKCGPVANGCGHIMHFHCFGEYYRSTTHRHTHQIARHHPDDIRKNEFVCPLCKALGNAFIPIIWKGLEESYPGRLLPQDPFQEFLDKEMNTTLWIGGGKARELTDTTMPELETPSFPGSLLENLLRKWSSTENSTSRDDSESSSPVIDTPQSSAFSARSTPEPGPASPSTGSAPSGSSDAPIMNDLLAAYRRLKDTFRLNELITRHEYEGGVSESDELALSDVMVEVVGFSIAATEIQQRGVEAQPSSTFVDRIPEQSMTHLRILAETASAFITIGVRHGKTKKFVENEHRKDGEQQHCQLFIARYSGVSTPYARRPLDTYTPLLDLDPFIFLVECAYGFAPVQKVDINHLIRLCYLAEIVKVVHHMARNNPASSWMDTLMSYSSQDVTMKNFADFVLAVTGHGVKAEAELDSSVKHETAGRNAGFQQPGVDNLEGWYMFVKKYALVFLRKTVLFMKIKYGVDFNLYTPSDPEADELDRLTSALRVPTFDEMCAAMTDNASATGWPDTISEVVVGWIRHQILWPWGSEGWQKSAIVSHPGIFELVGLPRTYDTLIEEATRKRCPTTGKELTDPVICLFCGKLVCSQGTCCQVVDSSGRESKRIGGAQRHMRE